MNDKVELGEVFQPPCLAAVQEFCCSEVFEVFVVGDDINGCHRTFKVVMPDSESFIDSE